MCVNYCGCPEGTAAERRRTCKPRDGCPEGTVPIGDGVAGLQADARKERYQSETACAGLPSGCPEGTVPIGDGVCRPPGGDGPKLKVEKAIASCCNISNDGTQIAKCSFRVTVTNIGTTPYSGEVTWGDNDPNNLSPNGASHSAQVTLAPRQTQSIGEADQFYTPGTRYSNCVALGRRQPVIRHARPGSFLYHRAMSRSRRCNVRRRRTGAFLLPALQATRRGFGGHASLSIQDRQAAARAPVPVAGRVTPMEIARRPRSAPAARYSTATPAVARPARLKMRAVNVRDR